MFDKIGEVSFTARAVPLKRGYMNGSANLMNENHALLQELTVSSPELDQLVEATRASAGALGAKLSGGGRGGNMIALVKSEMAETVALALQDSGRRRISLPHRSSEMAYATTALSGSRRSGYSGFRTPGLRCLGFMLRSCFPFYWHDHGLPVKSFSKAITFTGWSLSVLLSGSVAGFPVFLLWSSFGVVDDLSAHVAALGLNPANWSRSSPTFRWSIRWWRNTSGVAIWEAPQRQLYLLPILCMLGFHALILTGKVCR